MKARIREWNGGQYGKMGEYIAEIEPQYFKNGNIKKSKFDISEIYETIKKGYGYRGSSKSYQIVSIFEGENEKWI